MTIKIITVTDLKLNFYDVEKIIEKEHTVFLQNTVHPFIIGINNVPGTPMSTYGIDIYKDYIADIWIKD